MVSAAKGPRVTRVGIFSGTFDPVHKGHIAFALTALRAAQLDAVYFVPEPSPRRKQGVTHYAHRIAMLKLALKPYKKLDVLELPDKQFSVAKTLPRLQKRFQDAELYHIMGSDMLELLASANGGREWPGYDQYLRTVKLLIGVRSDTAKQKVVSQLQQFQPDGKVVVAASAEVSSSTIRLAVSRGKVPDELLKSLRQYVKKHWLYASIDGVAANNSL